MKVDTDVDDARRDETFELRVRRLFAIGAVVIIAIDGGLLRGQHGGSCVVETILGGPVFAGDGMQATEARFLGLNAIALAQDALIIAETRNHRIRRIDAQGVIRTIAGNGIPETSGDGGSAINASIRYPQYLAAHADGSIGFLDGDGRLREIQPNGTILSVTNEVFDFPLSLAAGPDGSYYVGTGALSAGAFSGVRRVHRDGRVVAVAGNGAFPEVTREGDGLPATEAPVGVPRDVAVDASGRLWIVESRPTTQIRRVDEDGTISTIAGGGSQSISEAPLDALDANLSGAVDLALIPGSGDVYLLVNSTLVRLSNGRLEHIQQLARGDIAADAGENLYLASQDRISRRSPDGAQAQIAGPPHPDYTEPSIAADTPTPWLGVAVEPDGDLLLHHTRYVYRWTQGNASVQKIAGNGQLWTLNNDIPALDSGFNSIRQVAGDAEGGVYVADEHVSQLRYIDPSGIIRRVAGTTVRENFDRLVTTPTSATTVSLYDLDSVSVGPDGMVYFTEASRGRSRVFRLDADGMIQEYPLEAPGRIPNADAVVAAMPGVAYVLERSLSQVFRLGSSSSDVAPGPPIHPDLMQSTRAFAIDEEGSLYWVGGNSSILWRVRTNGVSERITSLDIGSEQEGTSAARMKMPPVQSIAVTPSGDLLFVDRGAGRVRKIHDVSSCPGVLHPLVTRDGVVNGAHFLRRQLLSPGEIVSLFGVNLGPVTPSTGRLDQSGRLASEVAGVRVLVDGVPAPIVFVSSGQLTFVTPNEIGDAFDLVVENNGERSDELGFPFAFELGRTSAGPGLFALNFEASGWQAAALNQDGTVNGPNSPARPGEAIVLFGTGMGKMTPELANGSIVSADLPRIDGSVRVEIGGHEAKLLYAGAAPQLVYGVAQINALIPADLETSGRVSVVVFVDEAGSHRNVIIEVRK